MDHNRNLLSRFGVWALGVCAAMLMLPGCFGGDRGFVFTDDVEYFNSLASETEYADAALTAGDDLLDTPPPLSRCSIPPTTESRKFPLTAFQKEVNPSFQSVLIVA